MYGGKHYLFCMYVTLLESNFILLADVLFPATQQSGQPHTRTGRRAMDLSIMKFYSL